jgi:hypothetical protein
LFGNILSNAEIIRLRDQKILTIDPFDIHKLKVAHYRLSAESVWTPHVKADGPASQKFDHSFDNDEIFVFKPNAYHLVEVSEFIHLPDGVVATFVPVSDFALRGFALVAGKLDAGYGELKNRRQKLLFGVKNLLDQENPFDRRIGLAHMSLVSLTGTHLLRQELTAAEEDRLAQRDPARWRRADDDGVFYTS